MAKGVNTVTYKFLEDIAKQKKSVPSSKRLKFVLKQAMMVECCLISAPPSLENYELERRICRRHIKTHI